MRRLLQLPLVIWQTRQSNAIFSVLLAIAVVIGAGVAARSATRIGHRVTTNRPKIEAGRLDLREYDFRRSGPVDLSGDWQFYWRELLLPSGRLHQTPSSSGTGAKLTHVPTKWNGQPLGGLELSGQGYATYRLRVLLPREFSDRPPLALGLESASTSVRVFANQTLIIERGQVADNPADIEEAMVPALVPLSGLGKELELTVHVANFAHSRGGLWTAPRLGAADDLRAEQSRSLGTDLFLSGALLIMGCYHLILYLLRPADRSPLYFGVLCVLINLRAIVTGEQWLVQNFPDIPFDVYYRLEYLSFYLSLPAFALFIWNAFPDESHRWLMPALIITGSLFSALVVCTPLIFFTATLLPFQLITVCAGFGALVIGIWAWLRNRQGATLFVIGWLIFFGAVVHDILGAHLILQTPYLAPFGMFVFFFAQAAMLALRFTSAFTRSAELSDRLGRTERRYRRMIEEATEGIFLFERDGWIVTVNRALARMLGYNSAAELLARISDARREIFASEADWVVFAQALGVGESGAQARDVRTKLRHADGSVVYVAINGRAVSDLDTGQVRFQGMVQDVGEQRKLEQLRVERDAAEAASRSKSQFLANMSHEIRTPMNAILGMADLLAEGPGQREQRKYITILQGAGETLLALINDILDLAKVEAGRIELEIVNFDLIEVVESTVEIMANEARKKGLEISHRLDPAVPRYVSGDPTRVRQVLVNLLGNAIKFTSTGGVSVEVVSSSGDTTSTDSPSTIIFRVRDTGTGIPLEKQERIFDAFSQADNSTTREFGGTGLGLTISKRLAELMRGKIELTSVPGKGSTFSLHACFAPGQPDDSQTGETSVHLDGLRVLVVDDVALNRVTFRETLQACGARVSVVSSGVKALAELQREDQGRQHYDLILLDYHMPGMDGLETAAQIQTLSFGSSPGPRIIAITSDHLAETGQRFKQLGVAAHLFKPVKRAHLLQTVAEVMDVGTRPVRKMASAVTSTSEAIGERKLRIMVAEDNEDNRVLIQAYLKNAPVDLTLVYNGAEAVERFEKSQKTRENRFDLIFMDMQMPVLDGYEATRQIRQREAEVDAGDRQAVPIVALTAHAMREEIAQILDAGCDAHLAKPVKKARLLEAIQSYARLPNDAGSRKDDHDE